MLSFISSRTKNLKSQLVFPPHLVHGPVHFTSYTNTSKLHELIGKYSRPYKMHDLFLAYTKTCKTYFVKDWQICLARDVLFSLVNFQFSCTEHFFTWNFEFTLFTWVKIFENWGWQNFNDTPLHILIFVDAKKVSVTSQLLYEGT